MIYLYLVLILLGIHIPISEQKVVLQKYPRAPVILIPGVGGNQLKIKYNLTYVPYYLCSKLSDWYTIWISFEDIYNTRCFIYHLGMVYNETLNRMVNKQGVQVKGPKMGSIEELLYLSERLQFATSYYGNIVDILTEFGYKNGTDLFGAGYDFRQISVKENLELYFKELTFMIEQNFDLLQRPFVLVSHSMGGPIMRKFLSLKDNSWKDKYIEYWFSINGAFAGSLNAIVSVTEGYSFGFPEIIAHHDKLKELEASNPSTYYLFPTAKYFGEDKVIFMSPSRNYTIKDIETVLSFKKVDYGTLLYSQREEIWVDEDDLGVNFHCFYTTGLKTVDHIVVDKNLNYLYDESHNGIGDGTVTQDSLESCNKFPNLYHKSTYEVHENIEHVDVLRGRIVTESLMTLLRSLQDH